MNIRSGIINDSITRVKEHNVAIAEISCDGNNIMNVRNIPLFPSIGAVQSSETNNNNNASDVIDNRTANRYLNASLSLILLHFDHSTSFIYLIVIAWNPSDLEQTAWIPAMNRRDYQNLCLEKLKKINQFLEALVLMICLTTRHLCRLMG